MSPNGESPTMRYSNWEQRQMDAESGLRMDRELAKRATLMSDTIAINIALWGMIGCVVMEFWK